MSKEIEHLEKLIKAQESKVDSLEQQMRHAEKGLRASRLRFGYLKFGVKPGVIVIVKGVRYKVAGVDTEISKIKPWLSAHLQKKDGTYGVAIRHLYTDWELDR